MKTHLYLSWYFDSNNQRQEELNYCLLSSANTAGYDWIHLFVEEKDRVQTDAFITDNFHILTSQIITIKAVDQRPTVNTYLNAAAEYPDDLHIFHNSDIYIERMMLDTIKEFYNRPGNEKYAMALSRWDKTKEGGLVHLDRWDSQDCWVFKGICKIQADLCPIGYPGSDNSLAWHFKNAGYTVINPSKTIQVIHLHRVKKYNYRAEGKPEGAVIADQICKEPYYMINPTTLDQI